MLSALITARSRARRMATSGPMTYLVMKGGLLSAAPHHARLAQGRWARGTRRRGRGPRVVEQRAKRADSRDQGPPVEGWPQPPVVEQRAKRAIRRDHSR